MDGPKISIVLPTYNGSKYIRKSIESCLKQTFSHFELIIVNDCSTDDTLSIIREYAEKDERVIIINNEFNKKLPISLNTGFEKARGKYFTWTSDDNYYAQNALQKMFDILEKNLSIDLVYTDYYLIDETDRLIGTREFGDVNESFIKWLGAGACFLHKREIHNANNGYNPAAFLIEDYDFFVRAFMKFNFFYLPTPEYYYYREHPESLTASHALTVNDISKIFLERNLNGLEKKLPAHELNLVYRKLAVYYAVTKSYNAKYNLYLGKMKKTSYWGKILITVLYVFFKKIANTISVGFAGIFYSLKLFFKK